MFSSDSKGYFTIRPISGRFTYGKPRALVDHRYKDFMNSMSGHLIKVLMDLNNRVDALAQVERLDSDSLKSAALVSTAKEATILLTSIVREVISCLIGYYLLSCNTPAGTAFVFHWESNAHMVAAIVQRVLHKTISFFAPSRAHWSSTVTRLAFYPPASAERLSFAFSLVHSARDAAALAIMRSCIREAASALASVTTHTISLLRGLHWHAPRAVSEIKTLGIGAFADSLMSRVRAVARKLPLAIAHPAGSTYPSNKVTPYTAEHVKGDVFVRLPPSEEKSWIRTSLAYFAAAVGVPIVTTVLKAAAAAAVAAREIKKGSKRETVGDAAFVTEVAVGMILGMLLRTVTNRMLPTERPKTWRLVLAPNEAT